MCNGNMVRFVTASCVLLTACSASRALAQRGVGDETGVARRAEKPETVSLTGTITEVQSGPCKMTTGRATIGTHLLLSDSQEKTLNIHLGPQPAVAHIAEQLKVGEKVTVEGFRTEKMSDGHFVAKSLSLGDETMELRDDNLRPLWAGGRGQRRGRGAGQPAMPGGKPKASGQRRQGQRYQGQGRQGQRYQGQGRQGQGYRGQGRQGQRYQGQGRQGQGYRGQGRQGQGYGVPGDGARGAWGPGRGMGPTCPQWGGPPQGRGQGRAAPPADSGRGYGRGRGGRWQ